MAAREPFPPSADRAFGALLRAYPAAFREAYGREMRAAFRSRWRDEDEGQPLARLRLWTSVGLDVLRTAPAAHFEILARDVRYALRTLTERKHVASTAAAVLTLALGIAAVTTIFSVVHAVLLAPLPYREPDRVLRVWENRPALGIKRFPLSGPNFLSVQERTRTFSSLTALRGEQVNLTGEGTLERVRAIAATANFWDTVGLPPVAGRSFVAADDLDTQPAVVMIGERFWEARYGRSPSAIGSTIEVNLVPRTIVGVAPQDSGFDSGIDLWMPLGRDPEFNATRGNRRLVVLGRLAPGANIAQANEDVQRISAELAREFPISNDGWKLSAVNLGEWLVEDDVESRLRIVLAAVALLLLAGAANVANLQLARATGRRREMAVRLALGASRPRLVRQMLTESLVLSVAGAAAGLALALAGIRVVSGALHATVPRIEHVAINLPVLTVAGAAMIGMTLIAGLIPALLSVRTSISEAIQDAGRSSSSARTPARNALVGVQMALATALALSAALLGQSLMRLQSVPLGFDDPAHLLTARITRSVHAEEAHERNLVFYRNALDEIRALPGVASVGLSSEVPFGEGNTTMTLGPIPRPKDVPEQGIQASWRIVTAGYLRTLNVPVRQGRLFDEWTDPPLSAMVSEGLARRLWPDGRDPIGTRVWLSNGQVFTILGIVGDVRQTGLKDDPNPTIYLSPQWYLWPTMTLMVRTHGDPAALAMPIREAVARIDPRQPVAEFRSMRTAIADHSLEPRMNGALVGSFAVLALLLASVGIAGVVSYSVGQRTREIAVRQALGSTPAQAVRLVMRGGVGVCALGISAGLLLALWLGRAMADVLYGISPNEPRTFLVVALLLMIVATGACWLPARRATRISPSLALRE